MGDWPPSRVAAVMMTHGSRAGMLLARCDVVDAVVVCLAAGGEDILISGSGGLRALAGAAGIGVGLIASGPPGSPVRTVACQSRPQLSGLALAAVPAWPGIGGFED
jgi:hypothetical protein